MTNFLSPLFLLYYAVPPFLMLWGSISLLCRRRNLSTVLLFIGSILYVLVALLTIASNLAGETSYGSTVWRVLTQTCIWGGMASSTCIAIGFVLHAGKETQYS